MGRNSVNPSTIAMIIVSNIDMTDEFKCKPDCYLKIIK
jgi:hypothetical protein